MVTKQKIIILLVVIIIILAGLIYHYQRSKTGKELSSTPPTAEISQQLNDNNHMILTSPAFASNQFIPTKYTCDGENISPALMISGVLAQAKSLALIVEDPDAPRGSFTHWLVWNIEPTVNTMADNEVPAGAIQGVNDAGRNAYTGPCPPSGIHHYHFKLFALDTALGLSLQTNRALLEYAMTDHILEQTELVGLYSR